MAVWSKNKVESSAINGGNEYEKKDRLSREQLNAITNNSFYASDVADEAKRIAENVEAGTNSPVSYAPQTLMEEQKRQARQNIGVLEKDIINTLSMTPSTNVETYSIEASDSYQEITSNGYVYMHGSVIDPSFAGSIQFVAFNDSSHTSFTFAVSFERQSGLVRAYIPVRKGQSLLYVYINVNPTVFRFIKAEEV